MPTEPVTFTIVLVTAFVATFISSMSGGGSAIITIPVYLWLGIPFPTATAIHQTSSCFWVLPASRNYLKGRNVSWKFLWIYAAIGLVGAIIGTTLVSKVETTSIKPIIGCVILCLVIWMAFRKNLGTTESTVSPSRKNKILMYLSAPFVGFYESFLGSGNGIIFSSLALKLRGFDLMESLGSYYFAAFFWLVTAVIILVQTGHYDVSLMIASTIGGFFGGYSGSKFGRYKGNKFIKYAFIVVGSILALKLLFGF